MSVVNTFFRRMRVHWLKIAILATALLGSNSAELPAADLSPLERDKLALASLQAYVGAWRGTGLPKRGSSQGAWTETSDWSWHFTGGRAALAGTFERDKYFRRLEVRPADKPGDFLLLATPTGAEENSKPVRYAASIADDALVAVAEDSEPDQPARITIRLVAGGDRMTVLFERRLGAESFGRLAEVGATRKGSDFAKRAGSGPECVVTGGLGTIAVEHAGKTYFVCCGGCKDLFDEDPAKVLAEYRERKAAERGK